MNNLTRTTRCVHTVHSQVKAETNIITLISGGPLPTCRPPPVYDVQSQFQCRSGPPPKWTPVSLSESLLLSPSHSGVGLARTRVMELPVSTSHVFHPSLRHGGGAGQQRSTDSTTLALRSCSLVSEFGFSESLLEMHSVCGSCGVGYPPKVAHSLILRTPYSVLMVRDNNVRRQ